MNLTLLTYSLNSFRVATKVLILDDNSEIVVHVNRGFDLFEM